MNKIILKIIVLMVFVVYSCKTTDKEKNNKSFLKKTEKVYSNNEKLVLDNGKRWLANPETTTGVENMSNLLMTFTKVNNVESYNVLAGNLQSEFLMIFKKCTMKGEAHNQLHKFLIPIKNMLETMSTENLKQCQATYNKLSNHLKQYEKFFK